MAALFCVKYCHGCMQSEKWRQIEKFSIWRRRKWVYDPTSTSVLRIKNWGTLLHMHMFYQFIAKSLNREYSPGGSTFLCEMTLWPPSWKCDVKSKLRHRQSMRICLKIIPAESRPDLISKDGAIGFLEEVAATRTRTTRWIAIWDQFMMQEYSALKWRTVQCNRIVIVKNAVKYNAATVKCGQIPSIYRCQIDLHTFTVTCHSWRVTRPLLYVTASICSPRKKS